MKNTDFSKSEKRNWQKQFSMTKNEKCLDFSILLCKLKNDENTESERWIRHHSQIGTAVVQRIVRNKVIK